MHTYNQPNKIKARHLVIKEAVENLTVNRASSAVVKRNYVRDIYDYFINMDELSPNKDEVSKIDQKYIVEWERLHDNNVEKKSPNDLTVCYLCGPEPNNDFQEFINFGILPQNIWAFENQKENYAEALEAYKDGEYPQPRIIKQKLESFFENTPKRFDIVYFDACSTLVSTQHSLKCLKMMFQYNRLNSIGALITNFSAPDLKSDNSDLIQLMALYLYFKESDSSYITIENDRITNCEYLQLIDKINENFNEFYDKFISAIIRDLGSILVPIQKIKSNSYFNQLLISNEDKKEFNYTEIYKKAKNNNLAKFIFTAKYLKQRDVWSNTLELFFNDLGTLDSLFDAFKMLIELQNGEANYKNLDEILDYFEGKEIYQFLDNVHKNMYFDIVFNQITYPMHYNGKLNWKCDYVAKHNRMFMDLTFFDECRYIYEWLPAMHQIKSAFLNKSWQYVFRFALDGLVKSRKKYNNELFFQGAVVSAQEEFGVTEIKPRHTIGGNKHG